MAITSLSYDFFEQLLVKNKHRPVKMISAGYPDSLISQEKLQSGDVPMAAHCLKSTRSRLSRLKTAVRMIMAQSIV